MRKLYHLIREALRDTERDYTAMGMRQAIVLLSIPMILEMGMEALFAIVDIFFVSRVGENATSTVGITESMLVITYSLAWGLGMGATALVARRTGEKDKEGARTGAAQGVFVAFAIGLLLAIPGTIFAPQLLGLMGAEPGVIAEGSNYARLMMASNVIIMLLFAINASFRGVGRANMALWSLGLANLINIVLDPLLIFGIGPFPEMGVTGAACATTIGRGCGVAFQLYHLFKADGPFAMRMPDLRPVWAVIKSILQVAVGGAGQFLIPSLSWLFLYRIIAESGTAAVAGYTVAIRIIIFALLPAWGMANAAATLVGQNLGAGQPDRAQRSTWLCGHYNMVYMLIVTFIFWAASPWIVSFFSQSAAADATAILALRVISAGYLFYGYGMVLAQAFNGAGDSMTPTWLNVIGFWIIEIPLAYVLAKTFDMGPLGVFLSIAISESILAVMCAVVFQRGRWKLVKV
ncbi:MAG: MATE family efflux transporter [Flavobacteriales bacterium]|nr:MATE family efflux transporter [Flavobacteriales bacterium]